MEKVCEFLKSAGTYYLATVEGDQPRVRPFGTAHSGQILNRVGSQKLNDFFHENTSSVFYSLTCALLAFRIRAKVSTVK